MLLQSPVWSVFGRISFRIAFVYFLLYFNPLQFLAVIPGLYWLPGTALLPLDALTFFLNDQLFHISPTLNQNGGGSGDTSFAWAQVFTMLALAVLGGLAWTFFGKKRTSYPVWQHGLCVFLRYSLAGISFSYGILKVFAMQMHFPNLSQLATPLGDYLPMRFSWMFIGYSGPYQIFSGLAEVAVALLLVWRKTALLGALLAVGVFANVVMLNFSYDIPVKIYSLHLLILSVFLVWQERERLFAFFVQNKAVLPSSLYEKSWAKKWQNSGRLVLKVFFFLSSFGYTTYNYYNYYSQYHATKDLVMDPVEPGIYHVEVFVKNGDTIPESLADAQRWRDVVFDYNGSGSIAANDSSLRMRYGRAYFVYQPDSLGERIEWRNYSAESHPVASFDMDLSEKGKMILRGAKGDDSLQVVLRKLDRHFPLTERQFHWISESNR
ncbi:hypothetical protein J0A68_16050 [Algoriphagus sp. H41]|uniref:DoxX family protein n=1 Tax=Algoriphagus oliviformis TaxID=2811231 RepID=A0ABS3C5S3_9BACT|nr:hypothetical protein [Algoriphagus oliviformis]MBN7812467.1 hypothetical protein [Algoriphagus oliviformis]